MNTIKINFFDTLDSTQTKAKELAAAGQNNLCLIVNKQTAGYGQNAGAKWESPIGNLYASFIMKATNFTQPTDLIFLTGVTWITVLKQHNIPVQCKWSNDLFADNQKLGGIMVEIENNQLICGMGLNITHAPTFNNKFYKATHVQKYAPTLTRDELIHEFFNTFETLYKKYQTEGFQFLQKIWNENAYHLNKPNLFRTPKGDEVKGIFKGIDDQGRLILETKNGQQTFSSGTFIPLLSQKTL